MTDRRHALVPVVAALSLVSSPAGAQQPVAAPPAATPPGWVITPTIGVGATWDDNITLAFDESEIAEDYLAAVSPSLALGYRGRRTTFGANYLGRFDFYRELSQFDSANQRGNVELTQRVSRRISAFALNNFAITPTTEDLAIAPVVLRRRTTRFNDFRGGVDVTLSSRTTLTTAYTSQLVTFARDEEVAPLLRGGHSHGGSATLRRVFSPQLSLSAEYEYQRAIVANGGDEFDLQNAGLMLDLDLTRSLSAFVEGGYAWLSPGRLQEARDAPTFRVGLGWQHQHASWDVQYGRAFMPSFGFGGTVQNEELVGTLRVPFTRRLTLTARGSLRENDPLRTVEPLPPLAPLETSLRSITAESALVFLATRWLQLEIYGTHSFQDSQVAGGQISRTRAGVQVATSRSMRVR